MSRRIRDAGASGVEYGAILMIASLIGLTLLYIVPNPVQPNVKRAVCKLFGGHDCDAPPFDYKPSKAACILTSDSTKVGGSITVFDIKFGDSFQFVRTTTADGKVKIMIVPIDFKLGAEAMLGEKTAGGDYGLKAGAKVEGTAGFKYGDTWTFDNAGDADKFVHDQWTDWGRREAEHVSPGLWVWDKVTGWKPKGPAPQTNQWEISAEGALSGSLGFGKISTGSNGDKTISDLGTGIDVEGRAGDSVAVTRDNVNPSNPKDPSYPRTSYTFTVKGSVKGGAKVLGYGTDGSVAYTGQTRVTYDKNGKLVGITWVTTHEQSSTDGYKNPGNVKAGGKGTDKQVTVTTTSVTFDDSNRAIGQQWLKDNAFLMPFQTVRNAFDADGAYQTRDPGPTASPMDRLLYDQGKVSRNTYDGNVNQLGLEVKVGSEFTFGFDASYENEQQYLVGSQYLGAPVNGQRQFTNWPECKK
jgi:YD repeat-containing protein